MYWIVILFPNQWVITYFPITHVPPYGYHHTHTLTQSYRSINSKSMLTICIRIARIRVYASPGARVQSNIQYAWAHRFAKRSKTIPKRRKQETHFWVVLICLWYFFVVCCLPHFNKKSHTLYVCGLRNSTTRRFWTHCSERLHILVDYGIYSTRIYADKTASTWDEGWL